MSTYNLTPPDYGVAADSEARLNEIKFGDGYGQRAPMGLNHITGMWNMTWTNRTRAEVDAIEDFFRAEGGANWFYWTTPRGQQKKFICKKWKPVYRNDYDCDMSATWEEVFDV